MKILKISALWLAVAFLCLVGAFCFIFPGYSFTGLVCLGILAVIFCYRLLYRLGKRKLLRILTVVLCLFLLAYAITGVIVISASFGDPYESCDYLIVLGAGVNGTVPSISLRDRLDAAFTYLQQNPNTVCIVSGGQGSGENITEAECMHRYLVAAGIPESRIIQEDQATSTAENLQYSLALMDRDETTRIGVLSSEYHLFRAGLMATDQGFNAVLVPAETSRWSLRMNYYMREVVALWYYLLIGG